MFKTVVILIQSVCAWIMSETSLSLQTAGLFPGRRSLIGLGNRSSEACQRDHDRDLSCQLKKKTKKKIPRVKSRVRVSSARCNLLEIMRKS